MRERHSPHLLPLCPGLEVSSMVDLLKTPSVMNTLSALEGYRTWEYSLLFQCSVTAEERSTVTQPGEQPSEDHSDEAGQPWEPDYLNEAMAKAIGHPMRALILAEV